MVELQDVVGNDGLVCVFQQISIGEQLVKPECYDDDSTILAVVVAEIVFFVREFAVGGRCTQAGQAQSPLQSRARLRDSWISVSRCPTI